MTIADVLTAAVLVLAAVTLALLLAMVAARLARAGRERRRRRLAEPAVALLVRAADDGDPSALSRLADLEARRWKALEPTALHLLGIVSGQARADLIGLFERRGVAAAAVRATHSRSAARRARAAYTLGRLCHRPAVAELCRLLADDDADVRGGAARALGRIGDPAAAAPLLAGLSGDHPLPTQIVAHALLRLDGQSVPLLRAALADREPQVRAVAIEVLGRTGAYDTLPDLIAVLDRDQVVEVQVRAVGALTRLGLPQVVEPLLKAADAPDPALRASAARALGELGDGRAATRLTALLCDPEDDVAREAAQALVGLGAAGAGALERAAADPSSGRGGLQARSVLAMAALRPRDRHARASVPTGAEGL